MTLPQIKRKPNFQVSFVTHPHAMRIGRAVALIHSFIYSFIHVQGPSLVVELESAAWQPPSGLKGFIFEANLPSLNEELDRDNEKVKNMAGTDESV